MADVDKTNWFAKALASADTDELGNFIFKHFFVKGVPMKRTLAEMRKLSKKARDDAEMVKKLRKPVPFDANASSTRNMKRSKELRALFEEFKPPAHDVYLDIGCNNGEITCLTGMGFDRVVGTDVEDTRSPSTQGNFEFHLVTDSILPLEDNSADVVTAIQVLHHVKDQAKMIAEIIRVLKPGGVLILREQDLSDLGLKPLFDLEHLVYDCIKNNMPYEKFIGDYYSNFHSAEEWDDMLKGLTQLTRIREDSRRFGRYYYTVYRK